MIKRYALVPMVNDTTVPPPAQKPDVSTAFAKVMEPASGWVLIKQNATDSATTVAANYLPLIDLGAAGQNMPDTPMSDTHIAAVAAWLGTNFPNIAPAFAVSSSNGMSYADCANWTQAMFAILAPFLGMDIVTGYDVGT